MVGQFLSLTMKGDEVTALGTFSPQNEAVEHATVLFMVVQGENDSMIWTRGSGEWKKGVNGSNWTGIASADGDGVNGTKGRLDPNKDNGTVRGIAVALVVLPAQPGEGDRAGRFEPPTIQALTWCVSTKLVEADATELADAMGVPA
jgi:hypothetical protein